MSCETYGFLLHAVLIKLKVTLIMLKVRLLQKLKKHKGDGVILEKKEKKDGVKRERYESACLKVLSTGFGVLLVL